MHVGLLSFLLSASASTDKPNIILIVGDDVGHHNVGYNGNKEVKTPVIDGLVEEGARFDRMYAYFWCSPSRASLMSGRFPVHVYQGGQLPVAVDAGLPLPMTTLAEKMRGAGYSTVATGKWHLGFGTQAHIPVNRGFDSHLG